MRNVLREMPDNAAVFVTSDHGFTPVLDKTPKQPSMQGGAKSSCPSENERDVQMAPHHVRNKINVRLVSSIDEVLAPALL